MSVFLDITAALDSNLNSMAGLPSVAWPNDKFAPVKGTLYVRPTLLPANTIASTISTTGNDENSGIYQIDIFAPSDEGKNEAYTMADTIAEQFKPVKELVYNGRTVRCMNVSMGSTGNDDGWFQLPVLVEYLAYTVKR